MAEVDVTLPELGKDAGDEARIRRFSDRLDKLDHIHMTAEEAATSAATPKAPLPKPSSGTRAPITFNVPNVTAPAEKLYIPSATPGAIPQFAPSVKTPDDVMHAMQQMVDDGVVTPEQARETLKKLGFKSRQ